MTDDLEPRLEALLAERGRVDANAIDRALGAIEALPERRPARRSMRFAAAAVVTLAVVGVAIVVLFPGPTDVATPSPSPSIPSLAPSPSTAVVTPSPTPTMQPRPVWAIDLVSHLECEGPPATIGMDVPEVPEPIDPGTTPEAAFANALIPYSSLPISGYVPTLVQGHWALQRYLVGGRAKVHIVSTNEFPQIPEETRWEIVGLRACDQSEFAEAAFGPNANTIWSDAAGAPVRTDRITSHAWPSHCFDKGTVLLSFFDPDYAQYVRDPPSEFEHSTTVPYDPDVRLSADALDTGYHTADWHLFTIPSRRAVFVRTRTGTYELWPRAKDPIACM